jgi:hypothetical protein
MIIPKKLAEAVKADIDFFGCPFRVAPSGQAIAIAG